MYHGNDVMSKQTDILLNESTNPSKEINDTEKTNDEFQHRSKMNLRLMTRSINSNLSYGKTRF